MARTLQVSDEAILKAAGLVLQQHGVERFSLAAVARKVGLTRAAITFRFGSASDLKRLAVSASVERFAARLRQLEHSASGDALLELAELIGSMVKGQAQLASFLSFSAAGMKDEELARIEAHRGLVLRQAIDRAIPDGIADRAKMLAVFNAHLTGSLVGWSVANGSDARRHMRERTAMLLDLLGISYTHAPVDSTVAAVAQAL